MAFNPTGKAPGVYVQDASPQGGPIAGVSTSVAGFIGVVPNGVRMPDSPVASTDSNGQIIKAQGIAVLKKYDLEDAGKPVLITSWAEFRNKFGDFERPESEPSEVNAPTETPQPQAEVSKIESGVAPTEKKGTNLASRVIAGVSNAVRGVETHEAKTGTETPENEAAPETPTNDIARKWLQHAVNGFFANDGSRCWVIRVENWELLTTGLAGLLKKFEPIDEISMVVVPGLVKKEAQELVAKHCATMKDRVAILDGNQNGGALEGKSNITDFGASSYAAIYYPWLEVADSTIPGGKFLQPPSGHVVGVCARVDATRGVHKAPANEVIQGVLAVGKDGQSPPVSKDKQGALNDEGINIIRDLRGTIKIWGARTLANLQVEPNYKYLSTRRYFNYLLESIDEGTQWVVFEPNAQALWQRITRTVEDFLLREWRNGALFGATPKEAFYVKCDEVTNPKDVTESGMVVTEIGVAIVKPAEFVVFNIEHLRGS